MPVKFVSLEDAKAASGLRMTTVSGVPSPWGEAAKGILHVKGLDWLGVRHIPMDQEMQAWSCAHNAPALKFDDEIPRTNWAEILMLAERLQPEPSLLPAEAEARTRMFGLAHQLMGEGGLGWSRRLQLIHLGMQMEGPARKSTEYLAAKYGYSPEATEAASKRVLDLLALLSGQLKAQREAGSEYLIGDSLTALDIYSAAVMALFQPLPSEQCDMNPASRMAFSFLDELTKNALDQALIEHRDRIYQRHLELPLTL